MNKLVSVIFTILVIPISHALAAAPASFTGEWAGKK
jgi:FlaG/FlaF family flagellin (archaellin)